MKFLTKNQVIKKLRQIAENHLQINGFGYGDRWELETAMKKKDDTGQGISNPGKQPFLWVTPIVAKVSANSIFYDFEIIIGDLVTKDESNELEVENDTLLLSLDVLSKLSDENYEWSLQKQSNIQPFTEKWDSEFSGHIMNVSLEFMFDYDYCQVPVIKADADILAFLTAAAITDETQIGAIAKLVISLKETGLWNRMHALYPFIGSAASKHSYNLKNPTQYKILWSTTGVTHNFTGITGDGITGYGDSQYLIQPINQNNFHMGVYIRNNVISKCAIGCLNSGLVIVSQIYPRVFPNSFEGDVNQTSSSVVSNNNSQGLFLASRQNAGSVAGYKNKTTMISSNFSSTNPPNNSIAILARRGIVIQEYSTFNIAFASIGEGLSSSEVSMFYDIIQEFQTTLNRQV